MTKGMHYNPDCSCKACRRVNRNNLMKDSIEEADMVQLTELWTVKKIANGDFIPKELVLSECNGVIIHVGEGYMTEQRQMMKKEFESIYPPVNLH